MDGRRTLTRLGIPRQSALPAYARPRRHIAHAAGAAAAAAGLSGRDGWNRAPATATRIAATDELAAVTAWLARYADRAATLSAYRREVERLILWAVLQLGKPLSSLTHEDLLVYERFLADPQPAARWVLAGTRSSHATTPTGARLRGRCRPPACATPWSS